MGFWDIVNKDVDRFKNWVEGNTQAATPQSPFPTSGDLSGQTPSVGPDQQKDFLDSQGYQPPQTSNPFAVDTSELFSIITQGPSPFTVIDLNPTADNGTRKQSANYTGVQVANASPAAANTITQISQLVNMSVINQYNIIPLAQQIGVTYQFQVTGDSFRVEKLPQGFIPNGFISSVLQSQIYGGLLPNDIFAQNVLQVLLGGCFVQFESTNNPMMVAKPGETIQAKFSTIFVTVFGSGGRWRLILGNNASIIGKTDDRALRQNLAIWDGGGILDNPMYHPTPFSFSGGFSQSTLGSKVASIVSNFDSGNNLTRQANGNVVGTVINNGYIVLWITSMSITSDRAVAIGIAKGTGALNVNHEGGDLTQSFVNYFSDLFGNSSGDASSIPLVSRQYNFQTPIRVVLGGFDVLYPNPSLKSGETLVAFAIANGTTFASNNIMVSLNGYALGALGSIYGGVPSGSIGGQLTISPGLLPFNPYPGDVVLPTN